MDDRQNLLARRRIISTALLGIEKAATVFEVCAATEGDGIAVNAALCEALGIEPMDAEIILTLQVRRFTPSAVAQLRAELADVEARISATAEK